MQHEMQVIETYDRLRKLAMDHEFYVYFDNGKLRLAPGILKIKDEEFSKSIQFDTLDQLDKWLQGMLWQSNYAAHLGFDQSAAETATREERDRTRILNALTKE